MALLEMRLGQRLRCDFGYALAIRPSEAAEPCGGSRAAPQLAA